MNTICNFSLVTSLLLAATLAGCLTTKNPQIEKDLNETCSFYQVVSPREAEGWIKSVKGMDECSFSGSSSLAPKEKAAQERDCGEKVIRRYVEPVVSSKALFATYMAERAKAYSRFSNGEISDVEMERLSDERWTKYFEQAGKEKKHSYYHWAICRNDAYRKNISSSYSAWPEMNQNFADTLELARRADKEKMAAEDFDIQLQKLWSSFSRSEQNALRVSREVERANNNALIEAGTRLMSPPSVSPKQCYPNMLAPMARLGCKNYCVNGQWAEICK